ncbi:hypothetical protein L596_014014 [Steinernema carpocapsae]|uniref:7TM GPCR serpentine receptor class x (Srx) domain-containing protein n=1 Tax=Steinernema carpocapsae TaxID=34508 RepID=A0A4V6A2M6_STECR|nr:hypothetical protein L596_014014 [Steinernema carpocapsae]
MDALNESFVFGSEVIGRGVPTTTDLYIGATIQLLATAAVILGIYNVYLIKEMTIFHCAFGWFWASRTIGEIGANAVHMVYSGPVTMMQPSWISSRAGIIAFTISYFFGCHACVMHQIISFNRMVAVCFPLKYRFIFTKTICKALIAMVWVQVFFVLALYNVIPCQQLGFSPTFYEFVFVKCEAGMERNISIVGTVVNRFCWFVCGSTVIFDGLTLYKIIQIKKNGLTQEKTFKRDVRFFAQTTIQNLTMMVALTMICLVNNSSSTALVMNAFALNLLLVTHVNNALALILFNPEVRARFGKKKIKSCAPSTVSATNQASTVRSEDDW